MSTSMAYLYLSVTLCSRFFLMFRFTSLDPLNVMISRERQRANVSLLVLAVAIGTLYTARLLVLAIAIGTQQGEV